MSATLMKLKNGKAVGPHEIASEMIEASQDYGIEKVRKLANAFYSEQES